MTIPPTTRSHPQLDIKLDETNYNERSVFVEVTFDSLDLLSHIDGTSPPLTGSDEKIGDWVATDRKAHGIVTQSVAIGIRMEMRSFRTVQEMWGYL